MTLSSHRPTAAHVRVIAASTAGALALASAGVLLLAGPAEAAAVKVPLGTAKSYAILAGQGITNTGPTTVTGDIGSHPNGSFTGQSSVTIDGAVHLADAEALDAKNDLIAAYDNAAGQTPRNAVDDELGGETLPGGVYNRAGAMALTGTLTLDGENNPNSVWVFQAGSTLTAEVASTVSLINGAQACNVYWQVGSSATLKVASRFRGTIMALTSIHMKTGARLIGRVLARNGAVTLDSNTITRPHCAAPPTTTTTTTTTGPTTTGPTTTGPTTTGPTPTGPTPTGPTGPTPTGPNTTTTPGGPTGPTPSGPTGSPPGPQVPAPPSGPPGTGDVAAAPASSGIEHPLLAGALALAAMVAAALAVAARSRETS